MLPGHAAAAIGALISSAGHHHSRAASFPPRRRHPPPGGADPPPSPHPARTRRHPTGRRTPSPQRRPQATPQSPGPQARQALGPSTRTCGYPGAGRPPWRAAPQPTDERDDRHLRAARSPSSLPFNNQHRPRGLTPERVRQRRWYHNSLGEQQKVYAAPLRSRFQLRADLRLGAVPLEVAHPQVGLVVSTAVLLAVD